ERSSTTSTAAAGRPSARPRHRGAVVSFHNDGSVSPPSPILADLAETATVLGTWLGGRRVDLDSFLSAVAGVD
ncbi:MAG: hypothetical protein WD228_09950, partial [Mycobacterium sp.]